MRIALSLVSETSVLHVGSYPSLPMGRVKYLFKRWVMIHLLRWVMTTCGIPSAKK